MIPGGIHWSGNAGDPVERADDEPLYPGDMEAAVALAQATDFRWLLYVEWPALGDDGLWMVSPYANPSDAMNALREYAGAGLDGFLFDGRRGMDALEDGPDGIGYRCPMPDGRARRIASEWIEGKRGPITEFATSGAISFARGADIRESIIDAALAHGYPPADLYVLMDYVSEVGERGPVAGWNALWD